MRENWCSPLNIKCRRSRNLNLTWKGNFLNGSYYHKRHFRMLSKLRKGADEHLLPQIARPEGERANKLFAWQQVTAESYIRRTFIANYIHFRVIHLKEFDNTFHLLKINSKTSIPRVRASISYFIKLRASSMVTISFVIFSTVRGRKTNACLGDHAVSAKLQISSFVVWFSTLSKSCAARPYRGCQVLSLIFSSILPLLTQVTISN